MGGRARKLAPWLLLAAAARVARGRTAGATPRGASTPGQPSSAQDRHAAPEAAAREAGRGRHADTPAEIPLRGWRDILIRSTKEFRDDQASLVAAGVTFYALLALFPGLGALVALYGLFADTGQAREHLQALSGILPPDALVLIGDQMVRIAAAREGGLSLAFFAGLALSIWSANGATKAVIVALNIAYEEKETRPFFRRTGLSLAFTLGGLAFAILAIAILALPAAVDAYVGAGAAWIVRGFGWLVLAVALMAGIALLYRYGPSRDNVKWRWISWGSLAVILGWAAVSAAFSIYVGNFAHYDRTYGSLGAVIGLMMWTYLSCQIVLFGAELNSEIEHQTLKDTTVGPDRPMGERGAVMADTVGTAQG